MGEIMKIITHGTPPKAVPVRAQCSHCGTEVEFFKSEAKIMPYRNETYYLIN